MKARNEMLSGIFIMICLLLLSGLVLIMGRERQIFSSQVEFHSTFQDVKGLAVGAPVRLGGIPIGRVSHIGFSDDLRDNRIHVSILVNEDYLDRVRRDSTVIIETQGLLGDRFVSISAGKEAQLSPNSELASSDPADFTTILAKAQTVVDNTVLISDRVNKSLEGITPATFSKLSEAAEASATLVKAIHSEKGLLHRLVYSEKEGKEIIDSVTKTAKELSALLTEIKTGQGVLHALVYEPKGAQTIQSVNDAAEGLAQTGKSVTEIAEQIRSGKGLLHDVLFTPVEPGAVTARLQTIVEKLDVTAENLKTASDALSKGTGTIGALLVDPKLYDNLIEVTEGAKRSFLLRQAIRSTLQ